MLLSVNNLPYSIYSYYVDSFVNVHEKHTFRPDLLVRDNYGSNLYVEVMCNEASNTSPLSVVAGSEYLLPSHKFVRTFLEV